MNRLVLMAVVAVVAACDTTDNDRPATLEYITEAILQPYCAQNVCHSSYTRQSGYAFDTVEEARKSLQLIVIPNDVDDSLLSSVLTRAVKRMPYDEPLLNKDILLIQEWIRLGAEGLSTTGTP
jgi:hypothetical protein